MAKIPLSIKSDLNDDVFEYLTETETDEIISIKWDLLNIEISYSIPKISRYWPKISEIKKHTPEFEFYENFGYTINNFSEFLIIAEDWDYAPNITVQTDDKVEISIGELTPIGQFIFDIFRENNYHPEFEFCKSIRVYGANSENVELYLLNAINRLIEDDNFSFEFVSLEIPDDEWDENETKEIKDVKQIITNTELIPNRLFFKGLRERDKSNAFLDFYRILEYYSVIIQENTINKVRNDSSISKRQFVLEMSRSMNDNERASLNKLIKKIADTKVLKKSKKLNLIDNENIESLSNNLYDFRNSIVHSKMNQKMSPFSKSIFTKDIKISSWRDICKELASNAMMKI